MAKELDEQVEAFRTRPLDAGPYTFVAADALVLKVREAGRVVGTSLIATGVNAEGYREILGCRWPRPKTGRLAGVLPRPGRPRPVRGGAGDQRRPSRAWWPPSGLPCRERPGSAAAPITRPT